MWWCRPGAEQGLGQGVEMPAGGHKEPSSPLCRVPYYSIDPLQTLRPAWMPQQTHTGGVSIEDKREQPVTVTGREALTTSSLPSTLPTTPVLCKSQGAGQWWLFQAEV
ncbi:hypothetical protein J4Q44_G00187220 [Coregonus suidteri]|uniref:Uncharacterized protein n=1 Tax=Coregonus suidteri TaxID=861788 RepID=A0AAN8LEH3_9TELE